jgi:hypothetical protein
MAAQATGNDFESHFGTKCEIRVLEERIKKNGELEVLAKGEFKPSDLNPDARYALVTKKVFDKDNMLNKTLLQVNSFPLLKVFRDVVGFYPTIATDFDFPFEMEAPFGILYHHWEDFEAYLTGEIDDKIRMHLKLLLEYMREELGPARQQNENMIRRGFITYDFLWTIFKPGELQYMSTYGHPRLLRLEKTFYAESISMGKYFEVNCSYVDFNGEDFGQAQHTVTMREKQYFGMGNAARITKLQIYPRRFAEGGTELEDRLRARGLRFLNFTGVQIMRYCGKHDYLKLPPASWYHPEERYFPGVWLPREVRTDLADPPRCSRSITNRS